MRPSWNEIRARAAQFSKDWADARYEKGDTQGFYNELFQVFGVQLRKVAFYERQVKKLDNSQGFIDLFWPGVLVVEQKSAGRDLAQARSQAEEYCLGLKDSEFPRYILVSDFQTFELIDLEENEEYTFSLADLPKNVEKFGFIIGIQKRSFKDQDPVNIKASELMGRIHDAMEEAGYTGHNLELYLVRLLFCLFADDTGIFEPGIFETFVRERTAEDGSGTGSRVLELFGVLNTPENKRQKTEDEDLIAFPYINGDLFNDRLDAPAFDSKMRKLLIEACEFSWEAISPAIFGSLFQSVMDKKQRREQGAHYTTEKNIMKVIGPLFLDDLREEFEQIKSRKTNRLKLLSEFQDRLAALTFFDPACGCGNFLIIAYRELRQLELEVLIEMRTHRQKSLLEISEMSKVNVDQFYGIEIGEFPARIAEVAMWMMDHIMNNDLGIEFGEIFVRIPLKKSPHILCGDALETSWEDFLPPSQCSYLLGNPPFVGAKLQTAEQREQVRRIANLGKSGGSLDYVAAWFIKAGEYVQGGNARIGFVATNSITQGEQVGQLWPLLFQRHQLEIAFAHRTFAWGSDARGKAHVHVVILGLTKRADAPKEKRLFSYEDINGEPSESRHEALTAYLFDASGLKDRHLVVVEASKPINGLPKLIIGSKPIDGGYFILSPEERQELEADYPDAAKYIHPYVGSREFLQGGDRSILHLADTPANDLNNVPPFRDTINKVRDYRMGKIPAKGKAADTIKEPGISSRQLAETPRKYHVTVVPDGPFLILPEVSSERRPYIPIGWLEPPTIPSNLVKVMVGADKLLFALLTSAMHMSWMRHFSGRLKSDYRYAIGLVYNTFPLPPKMPDERKIAPLVDAVLNTRSAHPDTTLANLYDPDLMPEQLRKAHAALDRAVDRLYRTKPFVSENERVEHLFGLYEAMVAPIKTETTKKPSPRRKQRG